MTKWKQARLYSKISMVTGQKQTLVSLHFPTSISHLKPKNFMEFVARLAPVNQVLSVPFSNKFHIFQELLLKKVLSYMLNSNP
jgi:hypothetical protein